MNTRKLVPAALILGVLLGFSSCTEKPLLSPGPPPPPDTLVSFAGDVRPILTGNGCTGCHPPSSGYGVQSWQNVFGPGDEARTLDLLDVQPGKPESSYLIWKLEGPDRWPKMIGSRMPPQGRDTVGTAEIATIRTWIRQGALDN